MLRMIFGKSKSGKTTYIDNRVVELIKGGEDKILVIVPDQITFETEKGYLSLLGAADAQKVLVLGFSRLCDYIYENTDIVKMDSADDCTKALLMSIALEEVKEQLKLYGDKAESPELAALMLATKKELSLASVTVENFGRIDCSKDEMLANKIHDISLALSAYESMLSNTFFDPDSQLENVAEIIREKGFFAGYTVFIDSYLSFTSPELQAISSLLSCTEDMYITFSYDGISKDGIFSESLDTISKIKRIAESEGVCCAEPVLCTYNGFYKTEELKFIESFLFESHKESFDENADSVTMYMATNRYDEIDFVARNIRRLIAEENCRFSDIAVVSRNVPAYSSVIDTVFKKYGISYFADKAHDISSKPLVKLISAAFNAVIFNYRQEDVLSLLKTGLTLCTDFDVSVFENYIYTWQINYSSFNKEFTANPRGFSDEFTFEDIEELKIVEKVRKSVIEPLAEFKKLCADADATEISKALYNLLLNLGVDKELINLTQTLELWNEISASNEQVRLWEIFCNTLNRTVDVMGDRKVSLRRYYELFMLQLNMTDISFIPRALDQISVGDIERMRLGGRKYVFAIGAVDGEFPRPMGVSGLFTVNERNILGELNILNSADDELNAQRELYFCYYALTSASHGLFVSYPSSNLKGEVMYPSVMISELDAMLPKCVHKMRKTEDISELLWASNPAYDLYAQRARNTDSVTKALENYFAEDENYKEKLNALKNTINNNYKFNISDSKIAEKLFGNNMYLSASKIEKYHMCRFSYFCQYGLKARERRVAAIDAMEYGTMVHYILENFFKSTDKADYAGFGTTEVEVRVSDIINEYAQLHFGGLADKSARFMYFFNETKDSVVSLIEHLISELSQSEFSPVDFELDIGKDIPAYKLKVSESLRVTVTGQVDRADILYKNGVAYIRIVDYKTGTKEFKLSDVIYGLNLQMLLYLSVIKDFGKDRYNAEVVPAGVLYMPAFVSTLNMSTNAKDAEINAERFKSLRMNGLLLDDEDVLDAMDKGIKGIYIPVSYNAKGELKGRDNLATLEEMGAIFAHIDKLLASMATELSLGNIHPTPSNNFSTHACDWCPYSFVCIGKNTEDERPIYKLDREEILRELGLEAQFEKEGEE